MKRHEKQPSADVRPRFPSRGAGLGLLASAPRDGSQDFYLSMMLDVPVPRVPVLRARLQDSRRGCRMSVNAVDWALRFAPVDARHNGAARVLMCLANVADDEGRNAHPTHRKLAAWCKCSVSTVKRHLSWLEANGLIRRGDQRQAGHFSEWHRPVVWDLCLGNRLELDPDFFDSNDIDSTRGGRPSTENRAKGNPGSHVDRGYGDGDTGKPQLTGEPRFTAVTPPPAHLVSYSTSLVRNNPSAPPGHLPASGETSPDDDGIREDGSWADTAGAEPPSTESAEAGSDAEMVCRTMASLSRRVNANSQQSCYKYIAPV